MLDFYVFYVTGCWLSYTNPDQSRPILLFSIHRFLNYPRRMSRFRLTLLSAFLTQCGRSACNSVQLRTISTISRPQNSPGYLFRIPYYLPLRWKSKSKGKLRTTALSKDKLPTDLLEIIRADEMNLEFEATLTRFKSALQQKLALKITPQMLADLTVSSVIARSSWRLISLCSLVQNIVCIDERLWSSGLDVCYPRMVHRLFCDWW